MEYCKKKSSRNKRSNRFIIKEWRYVVFSLTIFISTCVYATCWNNIACHNSETLSEIPCFLSTVKAVKNWFKNSDRNKIWENVAEGVTRSMVGGARRLLGGPGSSPPRCNSKCGTCKPCKPVHVPVPPGTPVTTEYYPEAWRCKCGDKLYMP